MHELHWIKNRMLYIDDSIGGLVFLVFVELQRQKSMYRCAMMMLTFQFLKQPPEPETSTRNTVLQDIVVLMNKFHSRSNISENSSLGCCEPRVERMSGWDINSWMLSDMLSLEQEHTKHHSLDSGRETTKYRKMIKGNQEDSKLRHVYWLQPKGLFEANPTGMPRSGEYQTSFHHCLSGYMR